MTDRELMQMALDALEHLQTDIEWQYKSPTRAMLRKVEKSLRARLAQPEPEPVAWQDTANPQQMVAAEEWDNIDPMWHWMYQPLYTAPPQREWQGLTDEEIGRCFNQASKVVRQDREKTWEESFCRASEAKLKEKNA